MRAPAWTAPRLPPPDRTNAITLRMLGGSRSGAGANASSPGSGEGASPGSSGTYGLVFAIRAQPATAEPSATNRMEVQMGQSAVGFEQDIRPLFRDKDVQSMSSAFDLSSYADVRTHADKILAAVAGGSMPCDGPWPAERVELLRSWVDAGCPA
jgi:hypothetical protein